MPDDFAFPEVPSGLRPLFLAVLDAVADAMREPGHAASIPEAMLRNDLRRLFEQAEVAMVAQIAELQDELEDVRGELKFVAERHQEH